MDKMETVVVILSNRILARKNGLTRSQPWVGAFVKIFEKAATMNFPTIPGPNLHVLPEDLRYFGTMSDTWKYTCLILEYMCTAEKRNNADSKYEYKMTLAKDVVYTFTNTLSTPFPNLDVIIELGRKIGMLIGWRFQTWKDFVSEMMRMLPYYSHFLGERVVPDNKLRTLRDDVILSPDSYENKYKTFTDIDLFIAEDGYILERFMGESSSYVKDNKVVFTGTPHGDNSISIDEYRQVLKNRPSSITATIPRDGRKHNTMNMFKLEPYTFLYSIDPKKYPDIFSIVLESISISEVIAQRTPRFRDRDDFNAVLDRGLEKVATILTTNPDMLHAIIHKMCDQHSTEKIFEFTKKYTKW
jgi:hypothetical protein